jgi:uncharacterized protein YcbX
MFRSRVDPKTVLNISSAFEDVFLSYATEPYKRCMWYVIMMLTKATKKKLQQHTNKQTKINNQPTNIIVMRKTRDFP